MATSYITPADQVALADNFNDLHATFARPIIIFRNAEQVVITSSSSNNILFPGAPGNSIYAPGGQVSGIFLARIKYPEKQPLDFFYTSRGTTEDQINIRKEDGLIRVKLDPTGASYLDGAQEASIDGTLCKIEMGRQPHGLFAPQFYTYFLKKVN